MPVSKLFYKLMTSWANSDFKHFKNYLSFIVFELNWISIHSMVGRANWFHKGQKIFVEWMNEWLLLSYFIFHYGKCNSYDYFVNVKTQIWHIRNFLHLPDIFILCYTLAWWRMMLFIWSHSQRLQMWIRKSNAITSLSIQWDFFL